MTMPHDDGKLNQDPHQVCLCGHTARYHRPRCLSCSCVSYKDDNSALALKREEALEQLKALERKAAVPACDHPAATRDLLTGKCRCLICPRCSRHTGETNQGHYWSHCAVTGVQEDFHFCCPGDCQLFNEDGTKKLVARIVMDYTHYSVGDSSVSCEPCGAAILKWTATDNMTVWQVLTTIDTHHKENHD